MKTRFIALLLAIGSVVLAGVCASQKPQSSSSPAAEAEGWQKEFEDVCAKTQDAMVLPVDELKTLVRRCDALEPQIERLDETRKKVHERRLRQCRGLFAYVLDSKQKEKK